MLELGEDAPYLHATAGRTFAAYEIDIVIGVRGLAKEMVLAAAEEGVKALFVETPEAAGEWMRENLREGDVVLLKGSRGVKLERALEALTDG
jgi:UDP-N-acetylmuramoyl-tripeptide--D-alanyl-D-alanine ligase